jgi:alpha-L-fucosidase
LPGAFNVVSLRENIEAGQQVESFAVDALVGGEWTQIAVGTTIGHRRLLPLPEPIAADDVRVRILSSRAEVPVELTVHSDPTVPLPGVEPGAEPSEGPE